MPDEPDDDAYLNFIDPYLGAGIARAISAWARLEYEIDEMIWELARLEPEIGACLTAQFQNVSTRFHALISLARLQNVSEHHITMLNRFAGKANDLATERNRIVHDPWVFGHKTKKLYRLQKTARAKLDYSYKLVTEVELNALEARVVSTMDQFLDLRREILTAFWSSS